MDVRTLCLASLALATLACRPPLGEPSYPNISDDTDRPDDGGLPGDDPWDGTEPRLTYGAFYEGGSTDQILVDNEAVNYYVYEGSFAQVEDEDHVEGFVADRLIVQNAQANGFWGGGIHFDGTTPQDLTEWTTLHVALKSEDPEMEAFEFGMVASQGTGTVEGRAAIADYGFVADGEWHVVNIPLDALSPTVPREQVTVGLLLISATAVNETSLLIDDLYLTAEPTE